MAFPGSEEGSWPLKLEQAQGLRLKRGDVVLVDRAPHAVVGFDGRDEAYLCWRGRLGGGFDTRQTVCVPLKLAHMSPRDADRMVPSLPAVDHMGRPVSEAFLKPRKPERFNMDKPESRLQLPWPPRGGSSPEFTPEDGPLSRCVSSATTRTASPTPTSPWEEPSAAMAAPSKLGAERRAKGELPLVVLGGERAKEPSAAMAAPSKLGPERRAKGELPLVVLGGERAKACVLCVVLRGLAAVTAQSLTRLGCWLGWAVSQWQHSSSHAGLERYESELVKPVSGSGHATAPGEGSPVQRRSGESPGLQASPRRDAFEDLQITIPIVRPPGWREIQPLLTGKAVTFDERGLKETMTVKVCRWGSFVDRQRLKLEREIREARVSLRRQTSMGSGCSLEASEREDSALGKAGAVVEDDISELEQLVERMDDWKDLSRYSGKSISMASTRRGNEMKIHIIAFAEREDGTGLDFMRLCYRKSIEVRTSRGPSAATTPSLPALGSSISAFGSSLLHVLPFLRWPRDSEAEQERWVQLLQRPDVAKFTIALAFRNALEDDGVHFHFCDARLDDPTTI